MDDALIDAYCAGTVACHAGKRKYEDNPYAPHSPGFRAFLEGFRDVAEHLAEIEIAGERDGRLDDDRGGNASFSPGYK